MNISQAKEISLIQFLEQENYRPVRQRRGVYWYLSPLHDEKVASFKVNSSRNEWYDYGLREGGDIIDLAKGMYNLKTTSEALALLDKKARGIINTIYRCKESPPRRQNTGEMHHLQYVPLNNQALLSYLMKRKISLHLGRAYCCEVHYNLHQKHYFGIAFRNRTGGYEIRNPYFKGCIGTKDITIIPYQKDMKQEHLIIFEGFMDFLSYLVLEEQGNEAVNLSFPCDYIVMNSINCLGKVLEILPSYQFVHSFLDNDDGGKRTFIEIRDVIGIRAIDETSRFAPFNDLNDYLVKQTN